MLFIRRCRLAIFFFKICNSDVDIFFVFFVSFKMAFIDEISFSSLAFCFSSLFLSWAWTSKDDATKKIATNTTANNLVDTLLQSFANSIFSVFDSDYKNTFFCWISLHPNKFFSRSLTQNAIPYQQNTQNKFYESQISIQNVFVWQRHTNNRQLIIKTKIQKNNSWFYFLKTKIQ